MRKFKGGIVDELSPSKARPAFHTPGHEPKSRQDLAIDDMLADGRLSIYGAELVCAQRKRIAKRHARRKQRRRTRQAQRR